MSGASRRRWTSSSGFTLLELLVSISIFSLVVGMAMFSLRYAFGVFRHLDAPFAQEARLGAGMRDCVASSFVYIGERSDMFHRTKEFYTCFNGETDRMTFVSTKPMVGSGAALCRLSLRDRSVILEEAPLYADDSNYLTPSFETKERHETVLFANVDALSLEYFKGDKKLDTIKEDLPTLVKISVVTEGKPQQFFCRPQTDYYGKKEVIKRAYEPS